MKRFRDRLLAGLVTLLLVLFLTTVAAWVIGRVRPVDLVFDAAHWDVQLSFVPDGVTTGYTREWSTNLGWQFVVNQAPSESSHWQMAFDPADVNVSFAGVHFEKGRLFGLMMFESLTVPYPLCLAAELIVAGLLLWTIRKGSLRRQAGHCFSCGYDLRATPDRCPECGVIPSNNEMISK